MNYLSTLVAFSAILFAVMAPFFAVAGIILAFINRWHAIGRSLLLWGFATGVVVMLITFVAGFIMSKLHSRDLSYDFSWLVGAMYFFSGYTLGSIAYAAWGLFKRHRA
jgi:hypothetical protein